MPPTEPEARPDENPDDLPFQSTHDINLLDVQMMQSATAQEFKKGEGDSPGSIVTSHPFNPPVGREWACCQDCGLAEAAHAEAITRYEIKSPKAKPEICHHARPEQQ